MSTNKVHWNVIMDEADPRFARAIKLAGNDHDGLQVLKCIRVPYWFAQFAQWNTAGVTAACNEYLDNLNYDILTLANPFLIINAKQT